jgi:hypothetical protein
MNNEKQIKTKSGKKFEDLKIYVFSRLIGVIWADAADCINHVRTGRDLSLPNIENCKTYYKLSIINY